MKKTNISITKQENCLNCNFPFQGFEKYCPECGQKNQKDALSFKNFMDEIFKGFTSWDAKFWNTLFPLLTKPGKVSKDYIEGKRNRYTNPFRFYIITSVLFFLLNSFSNSLKDYANFISGEKTNKNPSTEIAKFDITKESQKDSINIKKAIIFGNNIIDFVKIQEKYPEISINSGLDSLKLEHSFKNKFLFKQAETINKFQKDLIGTAQQLVAKIESYLSSAIFILLPIFALFLNVLYFRKNISYIEHLIFIFHTQTVFFAFLILNELLTLTGIPYYIVTTITIIAFFIYFYLAMKKFYNQKTSKTVIKFILTITSYVIIALLGTVAVTLIAFTLM